VGKKLKTSNNSKLASGEDIEDGTMIQIMANENMQEWGHSIIVIDETVKVTKKFLENEEAFLPTKKASKWKNTKAENGQASGEDIEDGTMIQIMANENMQEWGHSMAVIDETIKVAKEFLERDKPFLVGKNGSKYNPYYKGQASGKDLKRPKNNKYLQKKG
jgi:hypothetical protein